MSDYLVKSACRVLEVLEYFAALRGPSSVGEIVRALGYPQSSTSVLLKSMATLGYLQYDERTRQYAATARVAMLAAWLDPVGLSGLQDAVANETGEPVVLAQRNGTAVQIIRIANPRKDLDVPVSVGMTTPLSTTATGRVLLSALTESDAMSLLARETGADGPKADDRDRFVETMSAVKSARATRIAIGGSAETSGFDAIATLALNAVDGLPVALGVLVQKNRLQAESDRIVGVLRRLMPTLGARSAAG